MFAGVPSKISFAPLFCEPGKDFWTTMAGFWSALVLTMWVYGGWSEASHAAEEMKNPSKDIPKALFVGISVVTIIYILINITYISHFSPQGLAGTSNPASDLIFKWFGVRGGLIMSSIIIISAMGAINGLIFTGGRMSYAISKDYSRLNKLAVLHIEYRTPQKAMFANLVITALMLMFSRGKTAFIENLTFYTSGVFWYFIGLVILGLLLLRQKLPAEKIPFKVPFYPLFPLVFIVMIIGLIWGAIKFKPFESLAGICVLTLGVPLYYIINFDRKKKIV
jgi:APA family basic amino acid/polyamine antiporter